MTIEAAKEAVPQTQGNDFDHI